MQRLRSWWRKIKKHPVATALIAVVIVLIIVIILGYILNWDWTGLTASDKSKPTTNIIVYQPGKTLWDWLGLLGVLAIPVVVGFGVAWFTAQQGQVSERENKDNQREKALQAYIDKISELLLHEHLSERTANSALAQKIARVRTITALNQLDARRIGYVFAFLRETGLMSATSDSIISLKQANLRIVKWSLAHMEQADLSGAYFTIAHLSGAHLKGANLSDALQPHFLN